MARGWRGDCIEKHFTVEDFADKQFLEKREGENHFTDCGLLSEVATWMILLEYDG